MLLGFNRIRSDIHTRHIIAGGDRSIQSELLKLILILVLILALHSLAMIYFEGLSLMDAIWLTVTTATTVGYGDVTARTVEGRLATIILIYILGIATLAQVAAMYFEYRQEIRSRVLKGEWSWKMRNHIVFLNCPSEIKEEYFFQAVSQLRASSAELATLPIIIVTEKFDNGIPEKLRKLNVVHVNRAVTDNALRDSNILGAHTVIVFSRDHLDPSSDSINFEIVYRLREMGVKANVIAEVVRDENRKRLRKAGADHVLRPIRSYPELLMRSILAPGSEQVIETLFNSFGEECIRYDVRSRYKWLNIINKLASNNIGLPIAYENKDGEIIINPPADDVVSIYAVFVVVSEGKITTDIEVDKLLNS